MSANRFFDQPLVLVDLETTGANPLRDRITEIGIVSIDEHGSQRWSSLVNPQQPISDFIRELTGIDDAMVAEAPVFAELAAEVLARLKGRVLVAHNARFDYGFLRSEFKRAGIKFNAPVLCTVKLSKVLYPHEYKHSLDALIARHGLTFEGGRHRALTDAVLLEDFLEVALREHGTLRLHEAVTELVKLPLLPPGVDPQVADDLPEGAGVFVFYAADGQALLLGHASNIRKRVLQFFVPAAKIGKLSRDMASAHVLLQQTTRIDWVETAGEFGAQLVEARLLRQLQPKLNPPQRREQDLCAWLLRERADGLLLPELVELDGFDFSTAEALYGPFRSRREARQLLTRLADSNGLCRLAMGLELKPGRGKGCTACALGRRDNVCVATLPPLAHNARLLAGLSRHRFARWPYPGVIAITEGPQWGSQLHLVNHWCYLGSVHDAAEIPSVLADAAPQFDVECYRLIQKLLKDPAGRVQLLD
ncbi:exonuclease domain-containing protein [Chitinilyticum piscinae]|uniref:DNA-directed DNA polymerase n=1 Tax=Chitinilyticum piscinae TaxID=2866724 RepID=A0A8J7FJI2_9NEIS|nr:exonuclease domain-containing protein [Chitinilyticum piscinae]MBE9610353.1 ethanolamine utilization protein [Chitinilyticum piscinae]